MTKSGKGSTLTLCAIGVTVCLLAQQGALGFITIDGSLSDWGVTPFNNWTPTITDVAYVVENWGDKPGQTGAYPYGGEVFDIEALYAASDSDNLYLALVTSMPETGVDDPYGRPHHIMPGDFAVDLKGRTHRGLGYEFGIAGHGPNIGDVYFHPHWSLPDHQVGFPRNGPSTMHGGIYLGSGEGIYADLGVLEDDGTHTYLIEMAVPWDLLLDSPQQPKLHVHYTTTCGNDAIDLTLRTSYPVPEPATFSLIALGCLVGASLLRGRFYG